MKKYQLVSLFWLISSMNSQNLVDLRTQTKNVDFSSAASTIPAKSGTTLPATCNPGEMFFNTNSPPGQNLYTCSPANTWTVLGGSSSTDGTVSTGTTGQFGYYAANGTTIGGRTLLAGDIPTLNYQSPLIFTGTGGKTASSTGSLVSSDCAKWDALGNIIDAGSPCANVANGSVGQFAFYSAAGSALTAHTLVGSDIPALNYQAPLMFTGTGTHTATSTGALTSNDCAKWDANGNVIDSGAPCATGSANIGTGTAGQFGFYAANGSALTAHTLLGSDIPALNYQAPLMFTGTGTHTATSTGALTSNDCAKWDANGNVIDSGAPCATGSANIGTGTAGQFGFYAANGSALTAHTLAASDIPPLSYQAPLTFTGTGTKTASSTGTLVGNDCAKWDANGNVIDSGAPCATGSANVGTGAAGQFGFYAANGSALTAHTLAASDIPALNYQAPLIFTGTGAKTATSTGTLTSNDCAKWDANGNAIDSGSPCASVATGTLGQFAFYSANGSALTAHTLLGSDIPALNYQAPLMFTGTGTHTATSTGALTSNDCAKWDANGNVIDSGAPCATGSANVGTGTTGQFGFYAANGSALTAHTLVASDIPTLSYQAPLTFTGTGTKTASSTGTLVSNDCAKWDANGNVVDAGAPCGSGGGGGITAPSSTAVGNVPQFSNTTGTSLSAGLGVVTAVGTPGADTNIPTEKAVRTAIAAAAAAAGNLPAETGTAGYLTTNGTTASWGNIATGGSGALDCVSVPGVCDIVTAIVPLKTSANVWTGANDFSGAAFLRVVTGAGAPTTGCSVAANVGGVYMRNDAQTTGASLYVCSQTGGGTYSWEMAQTSGTSPLPVYNAAGSTMSDHMVSGRNSFFSSSSTIVLSGAAAFTNATTYACTANDLSNAATVLITQTSGSAVTFSIAGGVATDNFSYICVGN